MLEGGNIYTQNAFIESKDLAEVMVEKLAPTFGYKPENVEINNIDKRPSEKIYEYSMTAYEAEYAYESEDMFMILPESFEQILSLPYDLPNDFKKTDKRTYLSNDINSHLLNKVERLKDSIGYKNAANTLESF